MVKLVHYVLLDTFWVLLSFSDSIDHIILKSIEPCQKCRHYLVGLTVDLLLELILWFFNLPHDHFGLVMMVVFLPYLPGRRSLQNNWLDMQWRRLLHHNLGNPPNGDRHILRDKVLSQRTTFNPVLYPHGNSPRLRLVRNLFAHHSDPFHWQSSRNATWGSMATSKRRCMIENRRSTPKSIHMLLLCLVSLSFIDSLLQLPKIWVSEFLGSHNFMLRSSNRTLSPVDSVVPF